MTCPELCTTSLYSCDLSQTLYQPPISFYSSDLSRTPYQPPFTPVTFPEICTNLLYSCGLSRTQYNLPLLLWPVPNSGPTSLYPCYLSWTPYKPPLWLVPNSSSPRTVHPPFTLTTCPELCTNLSLPLWSCACPELLVQPSFTLVTGPELCTNLPLPLWPISNWQPCLENYFDNPFEDYEDKDFTQLPLREKVKVLHQLCEYRLEVGSTCST